MQSLTHDDLIALYQAGALYKLKTKPSPVEFRADVVTRYSPEHGYNVRDVQGWLVYKTSTSENK